MEPTLVAVLAVESLKKLEMIGDHRQLPAFVQQTWYNLTATIPSIKISLFERLILGSNDNGGKYSKQGEEEKKGIVGNELVSVPNKYH
jgi:superfamily I DNA and/or RNA helicase